MMAQAPGIRTVTAREWRNRKIHEGWTSHQAPGSKKWKKYWMVLQKSHLLLFSSEEVSQETMIGTLSIGSRTEVREVQASLLDAKGLCLELTTVTGNGEKKVNLFKFNTATDCDLWKAFIMGITSGTVPESVNLLPGQLRNVMETVREVRPHPPPRPGLDDIISADGSQAARVNQSEQRPTSPVRHTSASGDIAAQAAVNQIKANQSVRYHQHHQFSHQPEMISPTQKSIPITSGWSVRSRTHITSSSTAAADSPVNQASADTTSPSPWLEMQQQLQYRTQQPSTSHAQDDNSDQSEKQQTDRGGVTLSAAAAAWLNQKALDDSAISDSTHNDDDEEVFRDAALRRSKSADLLNHADEDENDDDNKDEDRDSVDAGHVQSHSESPSQVQGLSVVEIERSMLNRSRDGNAGTVSSLRQLMRRQNELAFKALDKEQKPPNLLSSTRPALAPLMERNAPFASSIKSPSLAPLPENGATTHNISPPVQQQVGGVRREGWGRGSRSAGSGHVAGFEGQNQFEDHHMHESRSPVVPARGGSTRNPWTELSRKQSVSYNNNNHPFYMDPSKNSIVPSWFIECSREKAETILSLARNHGNVLLRPSSSHGVDGKYTISLRIDIYGGSQVYHYSVMRIPAGFIIDVDNPHNPMQCLADVMQFFTSIVHNTKLLGPIDLEQALSDILSSSPGSPPHHHHQAVAGWGAPQTSSQGVMVVPVRSQRPGENWPQPSVRANSAWAFVSHHQQ